MADGSWDTHRGSVERDALKRSAHLLPGRNSQGSAEQTGSRSIGTSLAERTSRGRSQSLAPRRGTLPFGPESGSTQQGAGDAPAPAQSFMEALGSTPEDETQSTGASTEVGRSKGALPGCLAFSRLPFRLSWPLGAGSRLNARQPGNAPLLRPTSVEAPVL